MAKLSSSLSIEPHMRTFDVFTAKYSAPFTRGFFCRSTSCARELFASSEPRQSVDEQARNRDHHSRDDRKQQKITQERRHIAPPLYLPCACPSCHSKGLAFVRCPTHETSRIVSRLPQDLGDRMSLRQFIPAVIVGLLLAALLLWLTLGWLLDAITLPVG